MTGNGCLWRLQKFLEIAIKKKKEKKKKMAIASQIG